MINYLFKVKIKIMNLTQELIKVYKMLGLKFSSEEKFATAKLKEGGLTVTNNSDTEFKVGDELFVVGEGSELSIAPMGQHTTSEGLVIEVGENGKIVSMMEETVEAPANEVGKAEEEVKTESEEMSVETETEELSAEEVVETETDVVEEEKVVEPSETDKIKEEMAVLKEAMGEILAYLKSRDEMMASEFTSLKTDFESFKKSPASSPVKEVKSVSQSFQDWRVEQLKKMTF